MNELDNKKENYNKVVVVDYLPLRYLSKYETKLSSLGKKDFSNAIDYNKTIEDIEEELDASVLPYRGSLCMASGGTGTKSIGSQFFITQAEYSEGLEKSLEEYKLSNVKKAYSYYGGAISDLVGYAQYTTFGQVIDGMDVVDAISLVETNSKDKPLEDVKISSIEITTYSK